MRIVEQMLSSKLGKFDDAFINRPKNFYLFFWDLYQVYNMANVVVPHKLNNKALNELWQKALKSDETAVFKLSTKVYAHRKNIYEYFGEVKKQLGLHKIDSNIYKDGAVAVSEYEYR